MNKGIKLEDYLKKEKNWDNILCIVNYYDYSLTIHHIITLYEIYKKTNKNRDMVDFTYSSDIVDLAELGLINTYVDTNEYPCPWTSPSIIKCCISEKGSTLLKNCKGKINENYIRRVLIPKFKKMDISIIIAIISFIISIISLFK